MGTGDPVSTKTARIKPFADSARCHLTDLGYLSSSEDRPHRGLSNNRSCQQRGFVGPSGYSPLTQRLALPGRFWVLKRPGSMTDIAVAVIGLGFESRWIGLSAKTRFLLVDIATPSRNAQSPPVREKESIDRNHKLSRQCKSHLTQREGARQDQQPIAKGCQFQRQDTTGPIATLA